MKEKINMCAYENKLICFESSSVDVELGGDNDEIRHDLLLEERYIGKIWGYVLDKFNKPIEGAIVTLVKREYVNKRQEYIKVDTVVSDKDGLYQFELQDAYKDIDYIVNIEDV